MLIALNIFWVVIGLVGLYYGAEWLVKGAAGLAILAGLSSLVVGLTVVAFGTSTPELLVCVVDNLKGGGDIALGNIIGSNICNIGMVLGVAALMVPFKVHKQFVWRELPLLVFVSLGFVAMLSYDSKFDRVEGVICTIGIIAYTFVCIRIAKSDPNDPLAAAENEVELDEFPSVETDNSSVVARNLMLVIGGVIVLAVAADRLVAGGEFLALQLGVSKAVIGLTLVAFGTSVPELATTVVACMRKEPELAVGNAIGSCLFNLLCVAGITAAIKPIVATNISTIDMAVMVAFAVATFLMMLRGQSLGRVGGTFLLISYVVYSILKFQ